MASVLKKDPSPGGPTTDGTTIFTDQHNTLVDRLGGENALTADRAIATDAQGDLEVQTTTKTELGYVNGVTSAIQTQLDSKLANTPANKTIYVDPVNGDDGTAAIGSVDLPYLTLNAAVTASSAGDKFVLSPGTHTLSSGITMKSQQSIVGAGMYLTTIDENGSPITITSVNGVVLKDLTIDADSTTDGIVIATSAYDIIMDTIQVKDATTYNIDCINADRISLTNSRLTGAGTDGIFCDNLGNGHPAADLTKSRPIMISNCFIELNGQYGIHLDKCHDPVITGNNIERNGNAGIYVKEPIQTIIVGNNIERSNITGSGDMAEIIIALSSLAGTGGVVSGQILVDGNIFANSERAILIDSIFADEYHVMISNNFLGANASSGSNIFNRDYKDEHFITIHGNHIRGSGTQNAITFSSIDDTDCSRITCYGNIIENNANGFNMGANGINSTIHSNKILNCTTGILANTAANVIAYGNHFHGNTADIGGAGDVTQFSNNLDGTLVLIDGPDATPTVDGQIGKSGTDILIYSGGASRNLTNVGVGGGDMILANAQTNTGAKTFNDTTLLLRNVAGTFNGSFTNTNTADRIYTLPDAAGTIELEGHTHTASETTDFDTQVRTSRLDQMAAPTTSVSMNTQLVTGVVDPVSDQDAATKKYVDDNTIAAPTLSGNASQVFRLAANETDAELVSLDFKQSVGSATTANVTLSGEQTIDGVLTSTSRILVKDQTAGAENGIYVTAAGAWARSTDFDDDDEIVGAVIKVNAGTANADTLFTCTNTGAVTVGSTVLTFTSTGGAGDFVKAGNNTLTGNNVQGASATGKFDFLATTSYAAINIAGNVSNPSNGVNGDINYLTGHAFMGYKDSKWQQFEVGHIRYMQALIAPDFDTIATTGDGKYIMHIPPEFNGHSLVYVHAELTTSGTGTTTIQVHNATDTVDMLSTLLTIDSTETGSDEAVAGAVIKSDGSEVVSTNDVIRVDLDGIATGSTGGIVTLGWQA